MQASFQESRTYYGSPRVYRDLVEAGLRVAPKRIARLMKEDGLVARRRKRFKVTTMSDHDQPIADNLLDRQFEAEAPNQRWVSDTTEMVVGSSGKLYLAAVLDLFSRYIVGWAISAVGIRPSGRSARQRMNGGLKQRSQTVHRIGGRPTAHVWRELPETTKALCASDGGYDSR